LQLGRFIDKKGHGKHFGPHGLLFKVQFSQYGRKSYPLSPVIFFGAFLHEQEVLALTKLYTAKRMPMTLQEN